MREFTPTEQEFLTQLLAAATGLPQPLDHILAQMFFTEDSGRSLILQPAGRFGFFYLKPAAYDDPTARVEEVRRLIELLMLLVYLRDQGFVLLSSQTDEQQRRMHFVGALFRDPKPSTAHIVLNERGDYTFLPETICDRSDQVIFKGVRIDSDLYQVAAQHASGLLYVSPSIKALIPRPPPPQPPPPPAPPLWARIGWRAPYLAVAAAVVWLVYRDATLELRLARAARHEAAAAPPTASAVAAAPLALAAEPGDARTEHFGVDLSRWNGDLLKAALATASVDFVFVRATHGRTTDPEFDDNWGLLAGTRVARGAYHFYQVQDDPVAQADHFLAVIGTGKPPDIAPAVDFEELSFGPNMSPPDAESVRAALLTALGRLESRTQRVPILYTNVSIGNKYLDDPRFARYPLWIADWTTQTEPAVPDAWKTVGYRFWQRSAQYTLPASGRPVDFDVFKGARSELYR